MSSREKRLLIFLGVVVFLVVHAGAARLFYLPALKETQAKTTSLRERIAQGEARLASQEKFFEQMEWLAKYEPQPKTSQKASSELEAFATSEAQRRGLTVKRRKELPAIEDPALNYYRAGMELEVSGREQVLYQWLDRLHSPQDLRGLTQLRVAPKSGDDTQVDATVVVEQWYLPEPL